MFKSTEAFFFFFHGFMKIKDSGHARPLLWMTTEGFKLTVFSQLIFSQLHPFLKVVLTIINRAGNNFWARKCRQ